MKKEFRISRRCVSYIYIAATLFMVSCSNSRTNDRLNGEIIENISQKVKGFDSEKFYLHSWSNIICSGGKIFITDSQSTDSIIGVFNASDLAFEGLIAKVGPSPEEITVPGALQYDPQIGRLSIFDYGQMTIKTYNVDSALSDRPYHPQITGKIPNGHIPDRYVRLNDSVGISRLIKMPDNPAERNGYNQTLCKYNILTGEIDEFDIPDRQNGLKTLFAVNAPKNRIVECAINNDLISIYDIDGNKLRDIQGPNYDSEGVVKGVRFFTHITTSDDNIFALYSGSDDKSKNSYGQYIHIYDLEGNYIKTLDAGMLIGHIAYDDSSNRLIMICEDSDVQLAYIDLNGIV